MLWSYNSDKSTYAAIQNLTENPRVGGSNPPLGTTYLVPYDSLTLLSPASLGFNLLKISAAGR